jgi:transcriptional regulator with XRE-family HTH domain
MATPEPDQLTNFGRTVRRVRRERDLTQEVLAERAGLHPTLISQIERGKDILLSTAFKIASGLGTSLDELVRETGRE